MTLLRVVGKTVSGGPVFSGVFRFHETRGTPLEVILEEIRRVGGVVGVREFLAEADAAGMSRASATEKLASAMVDVYGGEYWREVKSRLTGSNVKEETI